MITNVSEKDKALQEVIDWWRTARSGRTEISERSSDAA